MPNYEITLIFPGPPDWCTLAREHVDDWFDDMLESGREKAFSIAPAIAIQQSDLDGFEELQLTWVQVSAPDPMQAVARVTDRLQAVAPALTGHPLMMILINDEDHANESEGHARATG